MRSVRRYFPLVGVLALGYVLGAGHVLSIGQVGAQVDTAAAEAEELPEEAIEQLDAVNSALRTAVDTLKQEGRYTSATKGVNSFAVVVGGIDAVKDLEAGRGVDPVTFAALYAGLADGSVIDVDDVDTNDQGHVTYKNKVVRMYSVNRLKEYFQKRRRYAGELDE
ncbi:MAG: hypothetical protein CMJ48_00525 [Planctomycetaceae bacterium]|nr:hypothetical protein [Planctomycetaceae bacterium]